MKVALTRTPHPVRLEGSSSEGMSAVAYMIRDYNSMYNVCVSSVMMMVMMMMCVCRRRRCLYATGTTRVDSETVRYVTDDETSAHRSVRLY